jgi:CSLREA domain-containing protein
LKVDATAGISPASGKPMKLVLALAVALAVCALALPRSALAATITVSATEDETDFDVDCSLREAIIAANTDAAAGACPAGSGADTITVPEGTYTLSINGASEEAASTGDLDVTGATDINGAGARETVVQGGAGFDDRIFDNTATTEISGLTITGGNAGSTDPGGGVRNTGGDLTLDEVSVSDNTTADGAGGIISDGGALEIIDSTVSGNEAGGGVGGIIQKSGVLNIKNSTISGNLAAGGGAGGVSVAIYSFMNIRSSTIANNTSSGQGGGIFTSAFSDTTVKNSIVSANTPANCYTETGSSTTSLGYNIDRADNCGFAQPTDLPSTDPMLDPLADNGGPTDTHALRVGSQAIDAGDSDQSADQRGVTRPQDGDNNASIIEDDIGAFEQEANTAPEITPLSPDPGSKISDRTPRISAKITDDQTDLAKSDITLRLDGKLKGSFSYDRSEEKLVYKSGKLEKDRRHTVEIKASDGQRSSTERWSFKVKK